MKLVKEILYEKFSDESDPVHDMGIGIFNVKKNFTNEEDFFNWLLTCIPFILKTKKIPKDILKNGGIINYNYYYKLSDYFKKYITYENKNLNRNIRLFFWPTILRTILEKKGYKR